MPYFLSNQLHAIEGTIAKLSNHSSSDSFPGPLNKL
jgi:hypothetical protein